MNKISKLCAAVSLLLITLPVFAQRPIPENKWKSAKPKTASFTVSLPGKIKDGVEKSKEGTTYSLSAEMSGTAFIAADSVFTQSLGSEEDAERILDGSEGGIVAKMKAVLATKESIKVDGMPARRIRYTFQSEGANMAGESLLIFTGGHLYHMMVLSGTPGPDQKDAQRFFGSISLNGTKFTPPES